MCSYAKAEIMTNLTKLILQYCFLLLALPMAATRHIPGSAYNPELRDEQFYSLLNHAENPREMGIDIYGDGLYHPFASLLRFGDAFIDAFRMGKARHSLIGYQSPDSLLKAEFNILAGYEYGKGDGDWGFLYKGYRINAAYGKRISMNTYWWNAMFMGDKAEALQSELIDGYHKDSVDKIRVDNISADISYNAPGLSIGIGRGKFPIGNSISGSIILNNRVNDYPYLMAEGRWGDFSLSMLHASLMADSVYAYHSSATVNAKNYPEKFLAQHQFSYHPGDKLKLFMGETVVYGNRGIDLNYLLPNAFWRASEHNLWDRDNMLIFGGADYHVNSNLLLYAQAALDEFSYNKLFTNWWGNKYAFQSGLAYYLPWQLAESAKPRIVFELTAVRPYTYTHYMNHTMYSHDGKGLGYPKGSNLVDATCSISVPYRNSLHWRSKLSYGKQGSKGNSWQENYNDVFAGVTQSATANWFEGVAKNYATIENVLILDAFAHHRLLLGYSARHVDEWESKLYAGWQLVY